MPFKPTSLDLEALFVDPSMFDSRAAWQAAGFTTIAGDSATACMVAEHPSAPGYLFKKFTNAVSTKYQNKNYATRVEGSRRLAKFIERKHLHHVTVPKKRICRLPARFGKRAQLLIVERMDVLEPDATVLRYQSIAKPVLYELMKVISKYRGLDSTALNVTFLRDGRIAFIDLEHWKRKKRSCLKTLGGYLSKEDLALARKLLDC